MATSQSLKPTTFDPDPSAVYRQVSDALRRAQGRARRRSDTAARRLLNHLADLLEGGGA